MAGKHAKTIRDHAEDLHPMDRELRGALEAAADHIDKLERQLREAREWLRDGSKAYGLSADGCIRALKDITKKGKPNG